MVVNEADSGAIAINFIFMRMGRGRAMVAAIAFRILFEGLEGVHLPHILILTFKRIPFHFT